MFKFGDNEYCFNILSSKPLSKIAPTVEYNGEILIINAKGEMFNYAISTEYGSIVSKGRFLSNKEIAISSDLTSGFFQLDIFNGELRYTYSFEVTR